MKYLRTSIASLNKQFLKDLANAFNDKIKRVPSHSNFLEKHKKTSRSYLSQLLVELINLSAKVYYEVSRYQIVGKSHVHIVTSDFFIIFGNQSCKIFCKCSK